MMRNQETLRRKHEELSRLLEENKDSKEDFLKAHLAHVQYATVNINAVVQAPNNLICHVNSLDTKTTLTDQKLAQKEIVAKKKKKKENLDNSEPSK